VPYKQNFNPPGAYLNLLLSQKFLHFSAFLFLKEYENAVFDLNFLHLKFS